MNHGDQKNRMKSLKIVINLCVVVLVLTMYPQIKKVLNKVGWTPIEYRDVEKTK